MADSAQFIHDLDILRRNTQNIPLDKTRQVLLY